MNLEEYDILNNASKLTYSEISFGGETDIEVVDDRLIVNIGKKTTISGILESLYVLDNLGYDIENLDIHNRHLFNIKDEIDETILDDCLDAYITDFKVNKEKIYDYEDIDITFDYTDSYSTCSWEDILDNKPKTSKIPEKKESKKETEITSDNSQLSQMDEFVIIQFDDSKFKTLKGEEIRLSFVDDIYDDAKTSEMMSYVTKKVNNLLKDYSSLMNKKVDDIDQYKDVHLKRMALIEETRIEMKLHKLSIINKNLEERTKILCNDVKDEEIDYIKTIIASTVTLKNMADKALTKILDDAFSTFIKTVRAQFEIIMRILNLGDGY